MNKKKEALDRLKAAADETQSELESADGTDTEAIANAVSNAIAETVEPMMVEMQQRITDGADAIEESLSRAIAEGLSNLKVHADVNIPEIRVPDIHVPQAQVHVNVPETKMPAYPKMDFPQLQDVMLRGVDRKSPIPVLAVDEKGNPFYGQSGMGSPTARAIKDMFDSTDTSIMDNVAHALKVTVVSGGTATSGTNILDSSGVAYSGSNPVPVTLVSGGTSTTGTAIVDSTGVAYSGSNPIPVTFSAAGFQNVAMFDAQQSTITSHQDYTGDFRGLDVTTLRTITVESALNSTVTVLGSGGTFTGLAEDVKDYSTIQIIVFADQVSATDGLSIQQSKDGSNWDSTDAYTIPASTGKVFSFQVAGRYFRIVYTNGGTIQGAFRMGSYLHQTPPKGSSQRPQDGLSNENDFEQMSGFIHGFNESTWDRVRTGNGLSTFALRTVPAVDVVSSTYVQNPFGPGDAATALRVLLAGNADSSVAINSQTAFPIAQGDSATALRVVLAGNSDSSVSVTSITGPIGPGDAASGLRVVLAGNSDSSVSMTSQSAFAVNQGDTGPNTMRVIVAGDSATSTVARGDVASGATDSGNPVKIGAVARTTIPTAVADAQRVNLGADKVGRLLTRPLQVRDLVSTAYVALANGTETNIIAASAGNFLDCIWLMFSNSSSVAQSVDIRATTGGNIIHTVWIPAQSMNGWTPPTPWPQDNQGNNWTVDNADVTNSTIYVSGLFSKEV